MKLYSASASPYSRKARVLVIELGLSSRVEVQEQAPRDNSTGYFNVNPLARVPALLTDDGTVLYDSPVICEYLNTLANGSIIPAAGVQRWDALRRQALADGLLDTALPLRGELLRTKELQSADLVNRHRATIDRALDAMNREPAIVQGNTFDIGTVAIACALAWLDFRFADWGWRATRPALAAWLARFEARPSFQSTKPA
jgi:glutathione S-transferase